MPSADPRLKSGARKRLRASLGAQWAQQHRPCGKCGQRIDYTQAWDLDEIQPRAMGGDPLDPRNVQPAHVRCNRGQGVLVAQARRMMRIDPGPSRRW